MTPAAARRKPSSAPAIAIGLSAAAGLALILLLILATREDPPPPPDHVSRPTAIPKVTPEVQPEPPRPKEKEPAARPDSDPVGRALDEVRRFIARNPQDYPGQITRLKALASNPNPEVARAAERELRAAVSRFERAVADHFDRVGGRADLFLIQRRFADALDTIADLPENLSTSDSKARRDQMLQDCRSKVRSAFAADEKRVAALLADGKPRDAAALLRGIDYGLPDLDQQAESQRKKIQDAIAALPTKPKPPKSPIKLTEELKRLWADRNFPEALALVRDAVSQTSDKTVRSLLQPHLRGAQLLDTFWRAVLDGARSRVGKKFLIQGINYDVLDLDGNTLALEYRGRQSRRDIRALAFDSLYSFAVSHVDRKRADDVLMLALLCTYDKVPDRVLGRKLFDQALGCGAPPDLVTALGDLSATVQGYVEKPDPR